MAAILGETNFFLENWDGYSAEICCRSKISLKSLYLARFSRYKHFWDCNFCEKFKMAASVGGTKIFLKIGMATLQRYHVGEKFPRNHSISHGFRAFLCFPYLENL